MSRTTGWLWGIASGLLFGLAIVWPGLALAGRCAHELTAPAGAGAPAVATLLPSARQLGLLAYSLGLAAGATGLALLLALPGAWVVAHTGRLSERPGRSALLLAGLLICPMVYAFGWQRVVPGVRFGNLACIALWALWVWPIPAFVLGTAWHRLGKASYEAACLDASPAAATGRVVAPALLPHALFSGLIVFLLLLGEYTVPHACGLRVYATELLSWAQSSARSVDTVAPALSPLLVCLVVLVLLAVAWRRCADHEQGGGQPTRLAGRASLMPTVAAVGLLIVAVGVPVTALATQLSGPTALRVAGQTYADALAWSIGLAWAGGGLALLMGVGVMTWHTVRGPVLAVGLLLGALPGALVGEALVAGYLRVPIVYDSWLVLLLAYVARFGWIGLLIGWLAWRQVDDQQWAAARCDGATRWTVLTRLCLPAGWPLLLAGSAVVAALSLGDIATTSLVQVPGIRLVAHVILEKFHRLEDDMLIALSVGTVVLTLPAVVAVAIGLRRLTR